MSRIVRTNLIDVPWPVNLLQCSKHTKEMQPGDELIISLKDKDVKNSLILIFKAIPDLTFDIATARRGYTIHVTKKKSRESSHGFDFGGCS